MRPYDGDMFDDDQDDPGHSEISPAQLPREQDMADALIDAVIDAMIIDGTLLQPGLAAYQRREEGES